jgi:hypothetical protein
MDCVPWDTIITEKAPRGYAGGIAHSSIGVSPCLMNQHICIHNDEVTSYGMVLIMCKNLIWKAWSSSHNPLSPDLIQSDIILFQMVMLAVSVSITVQQDATIYSLLNFCKLLYMFRVVTPPIIRSIYNCNYSIWHWSNRLCYLPVWWRSWNCIRNSPPYRKVAEMVWPVPHAVITVICSPDDGWSYHPKHVEQFTEI